MRVLLLIFLFGLLSCRSADHLTESFSNHDKVIKDSVFLFREIRQKPVVIPQATAVMDLNISQLTGLPDGARFEAKAGNATGTVEKTPEGVRFIANCDSLVLLVEELKEKISHYYSENEVLRTELIEKKTVTVKEPSGFQWFQIWGFRIVVTIQIILILNKYGLWQKILKKLMQML